MFFGHFFMWPFMLFGLLQWGFWLLLIGGIIWAVGQRRRHLAPSDYHMPAMPRRSDPMEILRERYARGEITADEFDEMVSHLVASEPPDAPHPPNDPRFV